MECSHARLLLHFSGPGPSEIAADETQSLHVHLEQCRECRGLAQREQLTDAAFGPAMRNVPAAPDLSERIIKRLQRQRRPNPWPWVAGAAALLITAGLGLAWYYQPVKPFLNTTFIEAWRSPTRAESVVEWFAGQGVKMALPPRPDEKYLDSWEVALLQGRRVAKLTYVKTGDDMGLAHVYVIPKGAFRLDDELVGRARSKSGSITLEEPQGSEFMFLSIFTHGSLRSFPEPHAQ